MNKILLITSDFPPMISGISCSLFNFWRHFQKDKMLIVAPQVSDWKAFDKEKQLPIFRYVANITYSFVGRFLNFISLLFFVIAVHKKEKIAHIHCGQPVSAGSIGLLFKKIYGIPYSVYVYGGETKKYKRSMFIYPFLKAVIKNADAIIANSNFTAREFKRYDVDSAKICVVTPGVDIETFSPSADEGALKTKLGLQGKKILLTIARLSKRKGHDMVISILPEIINAIPKVVYLIVGDGPEMSQLKALVKKNNVTEYVFFKGFVSGSEVIDYYRACDLFIMLSRETSGVETFEGFGTSFIEANACGKPVIGGRSGGVEDAVIDKETGLLVDPLDKKEILYATLKLLQDPRLAKKLGEAGRLRAEKYFQWKDLSKKVEALLP